MSHPRRMLSFGAVFGLMFATSGTAVHPESVQRAATTWRGIPVAAEFRCSPYDSDDYRYPQSVETRIVASYGGVYGPYTGTWFRSQRETDIEHIVARSEAHDSGLCRTGASTKRRFARDLRNLTLAAPGVNRHQKRDRDAAEWAPKFNECWFAARHVEVRRAYGLTIDAREAEALERILAKCTSTDMIFRERGAVITEAGAASGTGGVSGADALGQWDDNGNGHITCTEARKHGIIPVVRSHPAYAYMTDGDGDGVVCER